MDAEGLPLPRIPVSTYRLQFNRRFTFSDATDVLPYLDALGISDIYASPYFKARKGTIAGYDIVDPARLNPEIGTEAAYNRLTRELQKRKMGQILDIVPNHMYVGSDDNGWWMDILENGPSSSYAPFFDINWHPVKRELENKVLIPILSEEYGAVLERQELKLIFKTGAFFLYCYDRKLPILPETYADILKHRIEKLETLLPLDDPPLIELLNIITALSRLPSYTEREQSKLAERSREKEIIKKRLCKLYKESRVIRNFIDENVHIFNGTRKEPHSFDLLNDLLGKQVWRLSYWRVAAEEVNYRRFFDINSLAAVRMEDPVVFKKAHELVLKLIGEGKVTGLRVDHPDGMYDPSEYLIRLQRECFLRVRLAHTQRVQGKKSNTPVQAIPEPEILRQYAEMIASDPQLKPFYVVGEKILSKDEKLPEDWPVFSTVGYDFLNTLNGIFVDTANGKAFDKIYERFIRSKMDYQDLVYEKKRSIMTASMSGEINTLAHHLNRLAEKNRHTRDFTLNGLRTTITEVIACFPVYRTYVTRAGVHERDRRYVEQTVSKAKQKNPALSESIFDFLKNVLLLNYPDDFGETDKMEWVSFAMRFQQVTGPVMAKGVEDTVLYVYNRFLSLNEVGGNPAGFGTALETFQAQNMDTTRSRPYSLITTSTHDTKRSEDVRARLNVLSEIPGEWDRCLSRWSRLNRKKKPVVDGQMVPDRNEEYLLYQTLLGVWPTIRMVSVEYGEFTQRIRDYMLKATREAKINSSWINPDASYEKALLNFIDAILSRSASNNFLKDFPAIQKKIAYFGMLNALSQTLLKITSPGVPDFYQGTEMWDFSLVDPDNRRPVNFDVRRKTLGKLRKRMAERSEHRGNLVRELLRTWKDGTIKLYVTFVSLNYRRENSLLFRDGCYMPLAVDGSLKENVCAFARVAENNAALVVVPRLLTRLFKSADKMQFEARIWRDTAVVIPDEISGGAYRNIFTDEVLTAVEQNGTKRLPLGAIFARFPVALLERQANS
ncbi:MAG TPA: malto-oligosyltrehalose synthase [Syntrophorhabdales bacterium]|nr:malto-oligosyltrehalose synthase [Syntrophorhabdales bacterium]